MQDDSTGSVPVVGASGRAVDRTAPGEALVSFDISKRQLFLLLVKNKFLTLLTFGIYRFWAKTHLRRLFWQGVEIGGDRLDYMGTGKELFLGFLLAIAILLPTSIAFSIGARVLDFLGPGWIVFNQFLYITLLYGFWQFARYRLWRYRLSRTAWRGIRFYLTGSAFTYAWKVVLLSLLCVATLGWAYPALQAFRLNYQLNNSRFGNGAFTYKGTVKGLYRIYWPLILGWQVVAVVLIFYLYHSELSFGAGGRPSLNEEKFKDDAPIIFTAAGIMFFFYFLFAFFARVWEFRYLVRHTCFGRAWFTSYLTGRSVLLIMVIMFAVGFIGFIGFAVIYGAIVFMGSHAAFFLMAFFFFFAYVGVDILKTMFLMAPLLKVICRTLHIHDFGVFEETASASVDMPKYGEGFADALDVGAF
ncbi:MAG: DUF898 family protein [Alphaproteobacteria bacterium]|nr:MAG: DUF898 family protein [Alphaproteobacteria bacterium]